MLFIDEWLSNEKYMSVSVCTIKLHVSANIFLSFRLESAKIKFSSLYMYFWAWPWFANQAQKAQCGKRKAGKCYSSCQPTTTQWPSCPGINWPPSVHSFQWRRRPPTQRPSQLLVYRQPYLRSSLSCPACSSFSYLPLGTFERKLEDAV